MFTGIIENLGVIRDIQTSGTNLDFEIECTGLAGQLKIDQSLAHDGVCLTVTAVNGNSYQVTAVEETLQKTNLGGWKKSRTVNLERAMKIGDRLDGHIVQGHVDAVATCIAKEEREGSHVLTFTFPPSFAALVIEKGSVCINGVSLTAFNVGADCFSVTVIPYTLMHTNLQYIEVDDKVNIEFDILGKYLMRMQEVNSKVKNLPC